MRKVVYKLIMNIWWKRPFIVGAFTKLRKISSNIYSMTRFIWAGIQSLSVGSSAHKSNVSSVSFSTHFLVWMLDKCKLISLYLYFSRYINMFTLLCVTVEVFHIETTQIIFGTEFLYVMSEHKNICSVLWIMFWQPFSSAFL